MNVLPEPRPTFPDDIGADVFVRELRNAVVPSDRNELRSAPPLVLLCVPSDDEGGRRRNRVLEALRHALGSGSKLVPYGVIRLSAHTESHTVSLTEAAAAELAHNHPRHQTPDRQSGFELIRDILNKVRKAAQDDEQITAASLRDAAYTKRVERAGLPAVLWRFGEVVVPLPGLGWLMQPVMKPLFQTFPRWWWARRQTRRLVTKGWLGQALGSDTDPLFDLMEHEARSLMPSLRLPEVHPSHEEGLNKVEAVLLRALLEDLRHPQVGKGTPSRRRRTARPVLLVELPPEDAPGAAAAHRFLCVLHQLHQHVEGPGPLVIAVGSCPESLLEKLGSPESENLRVVGNKIRGSDLQPVFAKLAEEPFTRGGIPVQPVRPDTHRTSARAASVAVGAAATAAVVALGGATYVALGAGVSTACIGDNSATKGSDDSKSVAVESEKWYDEVTDRIDRQNKEAKRVANGSAEDKREIRTVVHFISSKPTGEGDDPLFDGVIPELRGVALWQQRQNSDAVTDPDRVMLRVDVRTTGPGFKDAESEANKLVTEMTTKGAPAGESQEVAGVVGFAQSKDETLEALKALAKAHIPVVGTTATADSMRGGTYWPSTPKNSDETRIAAAFAEKENIVGRKGKSGECTPARHAVIVGKASDLYSRNLADGFAGRFNGTKRKIHFAQDTKDGTHGWDAEGVYNTDSLARIVCEEQKDNPGTVVYWAGRAQEFVAFVHAYDRISGRCGDTLTVLGGNDLTNVALTETIRKVTWLQLYYTAHRLPPEDNRVGQMTTNFDTAYKDSVTDPEADAWREDGHAAVAYDALQVLSTAMDEAKRAHTLDPSGVSSKLDSGISIDGATGHIEYTKGLTEPPKDKTLVILRRDKGKPVTVAACGAYSKEAKVKEQGPPCPS